MNAEGVSFSMLMNAHTVTGAAGSVSQGLIEVADGIELVYVGLDLVPLMAFAHAEDPNQLSTATLRLFMVPEAAGMLASALQATRDALRHREAYQYDQANVSAALVEYVECGAKFTHLHREFAHTAVCDRRELHKGRHSVELEPGVYAYESTEPVDIRDVQTVFDGLADECRSEHTP